ncbi:sensor histidine kinase [Piscinibacter sp. HJYY11]|uniref:sensor histidine kinase n=1 Tax=Piscinibacter sp. HJYY11 TaxID=2801333 RepID=UPI00191D6A4B|nr:ATP-binding protein [Piscinibacter sp. HJYY11]MBL0729642.1 sensor histidine kinase [Piscinibacter sp. HJYY11]
MSTAQKLDLYTSTLEAELARYADLPGLIEVGSNVDTLLNDPSNPSRRAMTDRTLARINARAGATKIAIYSPTGEPIAASESASTNACASANESSSYFYANSADQGTDYCFVEDLKRAGKTVARIAVTVSMLPLEATWIDLAQRTQSERLLLVDDNNVVVLSSVVGWKNHTTGKPDTAKLQASGRYGAADMRPLPIETYISPDKGMSTAWIAYPTESSPRYRLLQARVIAPLSARLIAISDTAEVQRSSLYASWAGGAAGAAVGLLALYIVQRRRTIRQLFNARNALQKAHDQLERQVNQRTLELQATNDELKRQIIERAQIEDELVQAGKLAALGQMSAGISHELNQPLTALRALSGNTLQLLEQGRTKIASDNLRAIDQMVERMGRIVTQLKSFARKGSASRNRIDLSVSVRNVLVLMDHRLRCEDVTVINVVEPNTWVHANVTQLEQVLLNLIANAIDAMSGHHCRVLRIETRRHDHKLGVSVADTGRGIEDELLPRLFEPFFTTKPAGLGLGLGLAISSKIALELGGTLRATRGAQGMQFEFDLEASED